MAAKGLSHNWETERSLLGGLLLDARQIPDVLELLKPEDFAKPAHRKLFELMVRQHEASGSTDVVVVLDELERTAAVDECGGAAYVAGLPSACPSVENLLVYASRVRDHAIRRRLHEAANSILGDIDSKEKDLPTLVDDAQKAVFEIAQLSTPKDWHRLGSLVDAEIMAIQERYRSPGEITGIPTGFVDLDKMLAGFQRTDLVVLAARPAMGKTAFALNLAMNAAMRGEVGVGIFSLEMSRQQLTSRLLCAQARVDASKVRTGQLDAQDDWRRLSDAADALHALPLYIDDTPGVTIHQLRSKARRLRSECPNLGLLVVDYLQLMQGTGGAKESRENAISTISRGLKILAKELEVPVIALSQLNRSLESRTDKRPIPSDLRESGAIEQDADVILFIYRDEVYNPESADKGLAEIIIAKQRSGPIGKVRLAFLGQYTLFQNYAGNLGGGDGYY